MTEKQAKKLKPGDKVVCVHNNGSPRFTKGKIYEIAKEDHLFPYGSAIQIVADNFGDRNGWGEEYFDIAYPTIFNNKLEEILND